MQLKCLRESRIRAVESEKSRDMMQVIELLKLAAEVKDYNPDDYFDKKRTEAIG